MVHSQEASPLDTSTLLVQKKVISFLKCCTTFAQLSVHDSKDGLPRHLCRRVGIEPRPKLPDQRISWTKKIFKSFVKVGSS